MSEYEFQNWLTDSDLKKIEYSDYWNDEEKEKRKEWYILDGNFKKMENYLQESGLLPQLLKSIAILRNKYNYELNGIGVDLAAGNLWAAPYLIKSGLVKKLYCIEFSRYRLLKLGPKVLEHYKVPKNKVILVLGNFYNLKFEQNSIDFILLSQAFHHADRPQALLAEIHRVLKPNGIVIIIGEHVIKSDVRRSIECFIEHSISTLCPQIIQSRLFGKIFHIAGIFPKSSIVDPILGDHHYFVWEYRAMFSKYNFKIEHIKDDNSHLQSFLLISNQS